MPRPSDERIDLCPGTLIVHVGGGADCTHDSCTDRDRARHRLVVDCYDVAGGCSCPVSASTRAAG